MKKRMTNTLFLQMFFCIFIFFALILIGKIQVKAAAGIRINDTNFPDKIIRTIAQSYDKNKDGYLSQTEIKKIKKIVISDPYNSGSSGYISGPITDFKGISYFTELQTLYYEAGRPFTGAAKTLDLSKNKKLKKLVIGRYGGVAGVKNLILKNCKNLEEVDIWGPGKLQSIDFTGCTGLKKLDLIGSSNYIKTLDISSCTNLEELSIWGYSFKTLSTINFGDINKLKNITISSCPKLRKLNIKKQTNLKELYIGSVPLKSLNVTENTKLKTLSIIKTSITKLDLSKNTSLNFFRSNGTKIAVLDLSHTKISKAWLAKHPNNLEYDEDTVVIYAED